VLAQWHPALQEGEATRAPGMAVALHEAAWERAGELERLRRVLLAYEEILAEVCEAPAMIDATHDILGQQPARHVVQHPWHRYPRRSAPPRRVSFRLRAGRS